MTDCDTQSCVNFPLLRKKREGKEKKRKEEKRKRKRNENARTRRETVRSVVPLHGGLSHLLAQQQLSVTELHAWMQCLGRHLVCVSIFHLFVVCLMSVTLALVTIDQKPDVLCLHIWLFLFSSVLLIRFSVAAYFIIIFIIIIITIFVAVIIFHFFSYRLFSVRPPDNWIEQFPMKLPIAAR